MHTEIKVTFEPSGRSVHVLPGTVLIEAAARAGFIVETPCGGAGKCGKCLVRITAGVCPPNDSDLRALGEERASRGWRLGCHCKVGDSPLTVEIPETSLFQTSQKILAHDGGGAIEVRPRIHKWCVQLEPPARGHTLSDLELVRLTLGPVKTDLSVVRRLPHVLREKAFNVTVTLIDDRLIEVQPGDQGGRCYGVAFDIGTTTVVGTLIDLASGRDLALASVINPQTSYGDDVLTRIRKCREEPSGLTTLHEAIIDAVNDIIDRLLQQAGVDRRSVYEVVFAGNTTMQEILCGINPSSLGEMPFVPTFRDALSLQAWDLNIHINHLGDVYVLPQIGGFVGGDTVAGIVATHLDEMTEPALLVDVGTNGEIVLANHGRLVATSVAAGPAFEGARISIGMRGISGAIEKVLLKDGDLEINVIGDAKPAGICGSGLVDAVAEMLRGGVLDSTGRILDPEELSDSVPPALRERVRPGASGNDFLLVRAGESATGEAICLSQRDIRELQLANAAIRAGIDMLLRSEGLQASDLGSVLLAGAFGNFIRRNNARRIGMLPMVPCERIRFVGNTASFGAKRVLLSTAERDYAARVTKATRHLDLSLDPEFQSEFGAAMLFPETELPGCDAG